MNVAPVADLTDASVLRRYGFTREDLTADTRSALIACRSLARQLVLADGFQAILARSAALHDAVNLMVYLDDTTGIRELSNGPHRDPVKL